MVQLFSAVRSSLKQIPEHRLYGRVTAVEGMLIEVGGIQRRLMAGDRCLIQRRQNDDLRCEVVGFLESRAMLVLFGSLEEIGLGCKAEVESQEAAIRPSSAWLGRVVNALGCPVDGKGPLPEGEIARKLRASPPPAHVRCRVADKVDLGVRALNTFLTCCCGQRICIFAGSGVGKSVLLAMISRFTAAEVNVIGERSREVQEFVEDNLGPEGLSKSVVVVAISDEPPLMRRQATYVTMAMAEYFRDQEKDVLCIIDSVTRLAMSLREIGLSAGEPPTRNGYPPTILSELLKLMEHSGPGTGKGTITGLFYVLVEGDDQNEPLSETLCGILDGHIVRSLSRSMPDCNSAAENALVNRARKVISLYEYMAEMIRLGAYRAGTDSGVDNGITLYPMIEAFLSQDRNERSSLPLGYQSLAQVFAGDKG